MMSRPALFSDLDLTLIYSAASTKRLGGSTLGSLVVEEYEEKPLSYMHLPAWEKLVDGAGSSFDLIPCTTRTYLQYERILFPRTKIDYAIVLNGGKIYKDGVELDTWSNEVEHLLSREEISPKELYTILTPEVTDHPSLRSFRNAEDYFLYIVKKDDSRGDLDDLFFSYAERFDYSISWQGRKVYLVPKSVSKGEAVRFVVEELSPSASFGAGDSVLDLSMAEEVDCFIQPSHGEAVGMLDKAVVTREYGITSSEGIINLVLQNC